MKNNYILEKELKFSTNVDQILSISLEEKHDVYENKIVGSFIISGEYKIHEISLNKEKFNFKIPYEHEVKNDIDLNTLNIDITDFIYDTDNNSLFATITYDLIGDRKDILLFDDEEDLNDFLQSREVEIILDDAIANVDDVLSKEVVEEKVIDELNSIIKENEVVCEIKNEDTEVRLETETTNNILESVNVDDDNFITYQVHMVKENDSIESIISKHNITLEELKEYNEFSNLKLGDKLIIPICDE